MRTVTLRRVAGHEMAWCGLLLDARSLQVRRDYSRYEGASLRDAVTIAFDSSPGVRMRDRTIGAIKSKLLPILLDAGVNSAHRQRYNIYQAVVFGALIMGAHASGLSNMYRHSAAFFTHAVLTVTESIFPHIKALEGNAKLAAAGASFRITCHEVKWLAAHAFLTVFKSVAYQHLRTGTRTRTAIAHAISELEAQLSSLEARQADGEQAEGAQGAVREGGTLRSGQLQRLKDVARVAFNSQLRSLRC